MIEITIDKSSCGDEAEEYLNYLHAQGLCAEYGIQNAIDEVYTQEATNYLWNCYCNEVQYNHDELIGLINEHKEI